MGCLATTGERPLAETISWKRLPGWTDIRPIAEVMPVSHRALGILVDHCDDRRRVPSMITLPRRFPTEGVQRPQERRHIWIGIEPPHHLRPRAICPAWGQAARPCGGCARR